MCCVPSPSLIILRVSKLSRKVVMPVMCLHFKGRLEKTEPPGFTNLNSAVESKRRTSFTSAGGWRGFLEEVAFGFKA